MAAGPMHHIPVNDGERLLQHKKIDQLEEGAHRFTQVNTFDIIITNMHESEQVTQATSKPGHDHRTTIERAETKTEQDKLRKHAAARP